MAGRQAKGRQEGHAARAFSLQRIPVRADGYDASGAYWGEGPPVYIGTSPAGDIEVTVRARNAAEARERIAAELARRPGETAPRTPLGGKASTISRYQIRWQDPAGAEPVTIALSHQRNYLAQGTDHLEIEVKHPKGATLPITTTGYLSHFIDPLALLDAGGPVAFLTAWLDAAARDPKRLKAAEKAAAKRQQGDLFQWADDTAPARPRPQSRTGKRRRTPG